MSLPVMMFLPPDRVAEAESAPELLGAAADLPYDLDRYFTAPEGCVNIPTSSLVATRVRPKGVANAGRLMRAAYDGEQALRAPVTVEPWRDGLYLVRDGNSTLLNALASGWPVLRCLPVAPSIPPQT